MEIPRKLNQVKNRILKLSPTVREGLERELSKEEFFSEGDKPIGKGGFGQVWKVRHKATDKIYVIKVMNKNNIIEQKMVDQINREVEIMYKINHPHVIKLYTHFEDDDNLYLIMHYASKGQLYSLLKKQNRFDQRTAAQYMREIISAMKYLHSFNPPIIHRDIKPENILLDENGRVKLADFGWSNYVDEKNNLRKTYCGTPEYLAPEMIKKEGHDITVDIWDLGVLMFELLTGRPPFSGSNQNELFLNIKKHKIQWPDDFNALAKNLILKILKQNPKERVTLDEISVHAWFEKNPPLRPVLTVTPMDDRTLLESHLIIAKSENVKEDITSITEKTKIKRQSITEQVKKTTSYQTNFVGVENVLGQNNLSEEHKTISEEHREIFEKMKKEGAELKQRCDKLEFENKTLKTENAKLKDPHLNKVQIENELAELKDELDKYKIMNKDRLGLLAEIEEKNNEIMDLKNKTKFLEDDLDTNKRNLKVFQGRVQEYLTQIDALDIKISDLRHQNDALKIEKDEAAAMYQKKIEILQARILENTSEDTIQSNKNNLLEMIYESISEFQFLFKNKIDKLEHLLEELKEDALKTENKFVDLLNERHSSILEVLNRVKANIEDDYLKIKFKIEKENPLRINERLEWLKKQIAELMPYKIKSSNLEAQIVKLETTIKRYEEMLELHKVNVMSQEKLLTEKEYKVKQKDKYILNLEARLGDVKDYLFRHHTDKLEEFKKWYKF